MDCINELRDSLNVPLGWNKARITCFVNMLLALLKGNSDTAERIELIQTFINQFGKHCIRGLLADREFIGKNWVAWLLIGSVTCHCLCLGSSHRRMAVYSKTNKNKKNGRPAISSLQQARVGKTMEEKQYCVYILASKKYGTLYLDFMKNSHRRIPAAQTAESPRRRPPNPRGADRGAHSLNYAVV